MYLDNRKDYVLLRLVLLLFPSLNPQSRQHKNGLSNILIELCGVDVFDRSLSNLALEL